MVLLVRERPFGPARTCRNEGERPRADKTHAECLHCLYCLMLIQMSVRDRAKKSQIQACRLQCDLEDQTLCGRSISDEALPRRTAFSSPGE
jgi:hypothetical protein